MEKNQYFSTFTVSGMSSNQVYNICVDVEIGETAQITFLKILMLVAENYNKENYDYPHKNKIEWREICISQLTKLN